ncbi:putative glucan 1,3-beta-glucosidase A [Glycine soja]
MGNVLPYKAVNLANWLVVEGWMQEPSLFDGIVNKDLLDGTQVQLKSTKFNKYLTSENGGGADVVANRGSASGWETFKLWRISDSSFNLRVFNKKFVGLENHGGGNKIISVSDSPSQPETFEIIRNNNDPFKIRIKASNGRFLQVRSETLVTADYEGTNWDESDPSVFRMNIVPDTTLQGEYQLTNGYGPDRAPQVMRDHWNTYITEDDFRFMSANGLNAVRIPVGWWIAKDPNPPKPFVGGSLAALDNAFIWAQNHGMNVIIDLHAAEGSQNGNDHSGARDGYTEWGDSYIPNTVQVIDFLAERYGTRPNLGAIELMSGPRGVNLESLKKYYKEAYDAVRKHNSSAYVIMSNPLDADSKVLLSFVQDFDRVVIDVHYYNLFSSDFNRMNVQQNIDVIRNGRASDLSVVSSSNALSFVGEWTGAWSIQGASKEDLKRYVQAQLDVYSRATFGWAYLAYKCRINEWSLRWMIQNGYICLSCPQNLPYKADGTQVQLKSTKFNKYLTSENGGGADVVANRDSASGWETFKLWRISDSSFNLRVFNKKFVGLENHGGGNKIEAVSDSPNNPETFEIIRDDNDPFKIRIKASNGHFLQVGSETSVTADYEGTNWDESDPSVFRMNIVPGTTLQGEYQLTNGYGPNRAPQIMRDHWSTYITEDDFRFMSENGLNAVRIPVGWWIAKGPNPPKPFVGGSLAALDNAFIWAQNHGMKVIIDLHAAEGSQNGNDHSGTRDGYTEWGDSYIPNTVQVIDFLAERYGNRPNLGGIELMNEPQGVNLESLKKYYKEAYDAVRKHNPSAYVIMSNPLDADSKVLLSFVKGFDRVVIDVHYYNLYSSKFNNMTAQQNIDYIRNERASDLSGVSSSNALSFVGEWTGAWSIKGASKEDLKRYAQAQLDVYSRATFGWAYWSYKCRYGNRPNLGGIELMNEPKGVNLDILKKYYKEAYDASLLTFFETFF